VSLDTTLPPLWVEGIFTDVLEIIRGISFPTEAKAFSPAPGLVACLRTTNVQRKVEWEDLWYVPEKYVRNPRQFVKLEDILISTANSLELVGKVAQVSNVRTMATIGTFIMLLRPNSNLNPRFMFHQLSSAEFQQKIRATASTTTNISNVSGQKLASLSVLIAPRQAQDRIVKEIEKQFTRLDAAVAALKRIQANLKRYRAAVLKAACEGRLVPMEAELARREGRSYELASVLLERILAERRAAWEADQINKFRASGKPPRDEKWKAKYKMPDTPEKQPNCEVPEGWVLVNLGQLSWSVKDGPHYSPKYVEEGIPFVTGGQVRPSGVDFASAKRVSPKLHSELLKRCKPEPGDILYTKGGTTGIARVNTYNFEFSVWVHVAVLKLVDSVEPFYIQHALNSPQCYAQARIFTHGVGNQDLGLTRMVRIAFLLPPVAEQKRVVAEVDRRLSVIDEIETQLAGDLQRAERLRQMILKRAFEGKLVPQNSDDEPASFLLERIRAEPAQSSVRRTEQRTAGSAGVTRG